MAANLSHIFQHRFLLFYRRRGDGWNGLWGGVAAIFSADRLNLAGRCRFPAHRQAHCRRLFLFCIRFRWRRFCCAVDVPVVTPGIATAIDGALNKLSNNSRIHGTVPSGENVEQNDKYRGQGAEGVFWEQSGVKSRACPALYFRGLAIRRRAAETPANAGLAGLQSAPAGYRLLRYGLYQ